MQKFTESKLFLYGMIPVCSLCWGLSFLATKIALVDLEPIQLLAMRWTIATLIFLALGLCKVINLNFRGRPMKWLLLTGLLQPCIYSPFETWGVDLTTASESAILIATIPLMALVIGELFFHKKTSGMTKLSILMALAGVIICIAFAPGSLLVARLWVSCSWAAQFFRQGFIPTRAIWPAMVIMPLRLQHPLPLWDVSVLTL